VPRRMLIGRAHHVLVAADILGNWAPQFGRFGQKLE
jgi:signal peptidase I